MAWSGFECSSLWHLLARSPLGPLDLFPDTRPRVVQLTRVCSPPIPCAAHPPAGNGGSGGGAVGGGGGYGITGNPYAGGVRPGSRLVRAPAPRLGGGIHRRGPVDIRPGRTVP